MIVLERLKPRHRGGFTLVELAVTSVLMALLVSMLSGAWFAFGQPAIDLIKRSNVSHEANLAAASIARDFAGYLPESVAGDKKEGKYVGRLLVGTSELRLCFDGGSLPNGVADWASPDTVIVYEVDDDNLIRTNLQTDTVFTVAQFVTEMELTEQGTGVKIEITVEYDDEERSYTIITTDP